MRKCQVDVRYRGRLIRINAEYCQYQTAEVIKGNPLEIKDGDKKKLIKLAKKALTKSTRCHFCC